jgi:hypothetical protein
VPRYSWGEHNNDELEIEPGYESFDVIHKLVSKCYDNSRTDELASKGDELEEEHTYELLPLEKKEYYEVFPYNGNQREIWNINYENLILTTRKRLIAVMLMVTK